MLSPIWSEMHNIYQSIGLEITVFDVLSGAPPTDILKP